jgi:hypothetical protein
MLSATEILNWEVYSSFKVLLGLVGRLNAHWKNKAQQWALTLATTIRLKSPQSF